MQEKEENGISNDFFIFESSDENILGNLMVSINL